MNMLLVPFSLCTQIQNCIPVFFLYQGHQSCQSHCIVTSTLRGNCTITAQNFEGENSRIVLVSSYSSNFVAILWQLLPPMLQYYKFSTIPKWMTGNFSYVVSFFFNNKLQQTNRETAEICYTTGVFPMRLDNSNESKGGACVFLQRKRQISEPGKS